MTSGLVSSGKIFQAPTVHQKNVEPAILIVVVERNTATGGFQEVLVLILVAIDGFRVEARPSRHIDKLHPEWGIHDRGWRPGRHGFGLAVVGPLGTRNAFLLRGERPSRFGHAQYVGKGQDECRPA